MEELSTAVVGRPETDVVARSDVGVRKVKPVAIGVGDGIGVGLGVVGKGPLLGGGAVGVPELNVGAWGRVVVVKVDYDIRVDGSRDSIGAIGERLTGVEIPLLGGGAVGVPELNVDANGAVGIINVESTTSVAGRDKRIGAVTISKNLPVLGTGAITIPELDIGASSSAGVVDIKVAAGDEVTESVVAGGLTLEVPLVGGSVGSGGQVDIGGVFDAVGAETDVISEGGGELVDTVGQVGGDGVSGQWVRLGWDLSATEPVGEVEEEVAIAIGRAGVARTVAGGKGGGVGLVGGVAIERGSGTILNINR